MLRLFVLSLVVALVWAQNGNVQDQAMESPSSSHGNTTQTPANTTEASTMLQPNATSSVPVNTTTAPMNVSTTTTPSSASLLGVFSTTTGLCLFSLWIAS